MKQKHLKGQCLKKTTTLNLTNDQELEAIPSGNTANKLSFALKQAQSSLESASLVLRKLGTSYSSVQASDEYFDVNQCVKKVVDASVKTASSFELNELPALKGSEYKFRMALQFVIEHLLTSRNTINISSHYAANKIYVLVSNTSVKQNNGIKDTFILPLLDRIALGESMFQAFDATIELEQIANNTECLTVAIPIPPRCIH